jgi:hypothetical protein
MTDPFADLDRVEAAYRRAWSKSGRHPKLDESLIDELRTEGLDDEWTTVGRPSCEVILGSWRAGDPPDQAMELMRFALKAKSAPGAPRDEDKMVTASVRDPGGNEFFIQASHGFGVSSPVFIGRGPDPEPFASGRVLGLVNTLLMGLQRRPRRTESTLVTVFRIEGDEEEAVHLETALNMAEARTRVSSIAAKIESGTFRFWESGTFRSKPEQ